MPEPPDMDVLMLVQCDEPIERETEKASPG